MMVSVCMMRVGDWTAALHNAVTACSDTHRPVWVQGPFTSPYGASLDYDNVVRGMPSEYTLYLTVVDFDMFCY